MPQQQYETNEVIDSLRVRLTNGEGKLVYDSAKDNKKPKLMFPPDPLKFCPACGSKPVALVYFCEHCGNRYQQVYDATTKRVMVITLPDIDPAVTDPNSQLP
jgi:hypothetical protein